MPHRVAAPAPLKCCGSLRLWLPIFNTGYITHILPQAKVYFLAQPNVLRILLINVNEAALPALSFSRKSEYIYKKIETVKIRRNFCDIVKRDAFSS
jgi:hypothetical protein